MIYIKIAIIVTLTLAVSIYDVFVLKCEANWKEFIHDVMVFALGMVVMTLAERSI